MNYCKDCKHYAVHRTDGPQCTKGKGKATSPISSCDEFDEAAGSGDAEVPSILAGVPDKSVQEEPVVEPAKPEKKRRGRKRAHENYEDENGVLMKWCRICQQYKPAEDFYRKTGTPDGYAYECKECHNARSRGGRKPKRVQDPMPAELKEEKNVATIEALLYSISLDGERRTGELRFVCAGSEIQKAARIFSFGSDPVRLTLAVSAAVEDAE